MTALVLLPGHSRPRGRLKYFCRLCRVYGIINRLAHLKNKHHACKTFASSQRANKDLLDEIFVEQSR